MKIGFLRVMLIVSIMWVVNTGAALAQTTEVPKQGGVMKVIIDAAPPTIDSHISTTTLVYQVGWHIFEGLFTMSEKSEVIPMLAKDYKVSEDGLTYTIHLREGISFHNGKEMTADDVAASLKRWGQYSGSAKSIFKNVMAVVAEGKYTVKLTLSGPANLLPVYLAMPQGGAVIYPKEIVEKAGPEPIKEYIGTGPFKFVEWAPNQYIRLQRYDGYKAVGGNPNGYGGKKVAYLDNLYFYMIADGAVRVAAVESGEYHFSDFVPVDEYSRIKSVKGVRAIASEPRGWFAIVFNKKEGLMTNKKIRQAALAALEMDSIMTAGYGEKDFWRLDPSIMFKEQVWWTDAGSESYNQHNIAKAKKLLGEAGYKGSSLRLLTGPLEYNFTLVAKNQLEKAGFKVDLQSVEWATLSERRTKAELWDAFSTGMTARPDPTQMVIVSSSYPGWWENKELNDLTIRLNTETDFTKRFDIWKKVQALFYEEVPAIKIGDYSNLRIYSDKVHGFANKMDLFFWNVWLKE